MARYATSKYGTPLYGNLGSAIRRTYIFAQVVDYSKVFIQLESLAEFGNRYVVVRTKLGAAEDPSAGVTVMSGVLDSPLISRFDEGATVPLSPGMNYYTVFIFDTDDAWKKDAATSVIVPKNKDTVSFMLDILPGFYTSKDRNPIDPSIEDSDLARFLYGFSLTHDELSTHIDLVLPENRTNNSVRRLHGALARGIGMPDEYTLGTVSNFRLYRESGYIYRNKGTLSGIATFVEALTGWQTLVKNSSNLLLSLDDASFEYSVGNWGPTGGALTRAVVDGVLVTTPTNTYETADAPFARAGVGKMTMSATSGSLTLPADGHREKSIPVSAGTSYTLKVPARTAAESPRLRASIRWTDVNGALVSTSSPSPNKTLTTSWSPLTYTVSAPSGAVFAVLLLEITNASVGTQVFIDQIHLSEQSSSTYEDPRQVKIICQPVRVNLLQDPSFDYATTVWTATSGSLQTSTERVYNGARSAKASGSSFSMTSPSFPVVPRLPYSLLAHASSTGGSANAVIRWYTAGGTLISTDTEPLSALTEAWKSYSATVVSPPEAASATVSFSGTGTVYVDAVSFEQTDRYQNFFSGIVGDVYGSDTEWSGTNQNSYSLLYPNRVVKMSRLKQTLDAYLPLGVTYRVLFWDSQDPEVQALVPYGA